MADYLDLTDLTGKNFYEVLEVSFDATQQDIKNAYRHKLLDHHPDKGGNNTISIDQIQRAYNVLFNETLRKEYDESFKKTMQRQGLCIDGSGLDVYSLDEFEVEENDGECVWCRSCPRCQFPRSMELKEHDLENYGTSDGDDGYVIVVQCQSCSLWIRVVYYEH